MRNLLDTSYSLLEILVAAAPLYIFTATANMPAQATRTTTSQNVILTYPTPRPPDLQRLYADDPVARAKQQQAALMQSLARRQQVLATTNKLLLLAQQLKDEMAKNEAAASTNPGSIKAQEIEKLARQVKKDLKSQ